MSSPAAAADAAERTAKRLRAKNAADAKRSAAGLASALRRANRRPVARVSRDAGSWNRAGKSVSLLYKKHRGSVGGDSYSMKNKTAQHVGTNMLGKTPEQRLQEFRLDCQRHPMVAGENLIVHVSLSRPEGHDLTLQQWNEVGRAWLKNIGAEGCSFTITRHPGTHDHVHIVYSRAKPDGTLVSDSNDFYIGRAAAREAARSLGIEVPDQPPKMTMAPTDRAVNAQRRAQRRGTPDAWVQPEIVRQAVRQARTLDQLQTLLAKQKIDFRLATSSTGQITGALYRANGASEWLSASSIARDLTLPKITEQISLNAGSAHNPVQTKHRASPIQRPALMQPPRQRGG